MSDLDNSNLTNEEENSGFSPSEPDNKSFSSDKGLSANATGNNDWGQSNFITKQTRKMPLWPFLLVGAFVLIGVITMIKIGTNIFDNKVENREVSVYIEKSDLNNHTKHIAINKHFVVETDRLYKHHSGSKHWKECDPRNCKPGSKCDPSNCKPVGKCDPRKCKPDGKCDHHGCKPHDKYADENNVQMHEKSSCSHPNIKNCEEVEVKIVNNELPKINKPTTKPRQAIPPKLDKPALQDDAKGLYVLQVYAALSKEEADAKYEEYKSKGVEKVWVSAYNKANVTWYRVRIGDFTTKASADAKAKELGINTYWVDRIK